MGVFIPHLHVCQKKNPRRSPATTAVLFPPSISTRNESTPFRRKEHLISDSLDKTMLEGSSTAGTQLLTRNPNALYIVVAEWLKLTENINLKKYQIDQIYILRKQKNTDREFRFLPKETLNKCSFRRNGVDSFSVKVVAVKMAAGVAELRRGPFLWQARRGGTNMPIAAKRLFIQRFPKYVKNPIYVDVVEHLFNTVRDHLLADWEGGVARGLERGYLI